MTAQARDVVSETPTDVENPQMYVGATYLMGGIGLLTVAGIVVLAALGKVSPEVAITALAALGGAAINAIGGLLTPRKG